ncbi:unnamed protein product [Prorocentrum cordatum]|uniref:Uncharacterized protein n=1 Tax=Prorocentrum cordatum TaxID=2364126 RepID=A0ABN9SRQ1_9DINO|nr:unnamed protein product [Polarella glacialis]
MAHVILFASLFVASGVSSLAFAVDVELMQMSTTGTNASKAWERIVPDEATRRTGATLLMKLKAGSTTFQYDSSYWTDGSSVLNEASGASSSDSDDEDVKMSAFNTVSISALTLCYKTLDNCYTYELGATYTSAQSLFSSGFIRSLNMGYGSGTAAEGKKAWTDLFLPPGTATWYDDFWNGYGGGNCDMQRPGINTQCNDYNWARIGYCVNLPDQSCQPFDGSDADSPVGIGLKTQNWPNNVNAPFGEYFIHGAGSSVVQSFQHQAWLFAGSGPAPGGAAAIGDPHLQNIHGDRFDLMKAGSHVLINIPRGMSAENALLRVQADARWLGGHCADMYFQELNITGSWADAKQAGGYHYSVSQYEVKTPEWVALGKVELKVVHGHTDGGLRYLNVYVKHLGRAGFAVGGLLGDDDHGDVIVPPVACAKHLSLPAGKTHQTNVVSVAEASLA